MTCSHRVEATAAVDAAVARGMMTTLQLDALAKNKFGTDLRHSPPVDCEQYRPEES